ncbi:hypothetical protein GGS20DRAFT_572338 [Poronia punctata]|nr:hypothetical protein GGS20DRAFT_572338 [Poronia punctata]
MKLELAVVALGSANLVCSISLAQRNANSLIDRLDIIHKAMTEADNNVVAYHGGLPVALRDSAKNLYHVIHDGVGAVQRMEPLTHEDVGCIGTAAGQVSAIGTKFLNDLGASASVFGAHGLCGTAYRYSNRLGNISYDFYTAAKAKFPAQDQDYADKEIEANKALFAKCQEALAPGNCVDKQPSPSHNHSYTEPDKTHATCIGWQTPVPAPGTPGKGGEDGRPVPIEGAASVLGLSADTLALLVAVSFAL